MNKNISIRSKKRKPKGTNYCGICGKYFKTSGYQKVHMKTYHVDQASGKNPESNLKFTRQLSVNSKTFWMQTNIFDEFENELPIKFRNDKYRCIICSKISANLTEHMEHEKIHYQISSVTNNVFVQESSGTENALVSHKINDLSGVSCISCQCSFTSMSDFDEHKYKKECKIANFNNHKNSFHREENEENLQKKDDRLLSRNKVNGHETQVEVLKQKVSQKFDCVVCKTSCESPDHFQVQKLYWESISPAELKLFECFVCNELFTDEKEYKTHEADHVKQNIC